MSINVLLISTPTERRDFIEQEVSIKIKKKELYLETHQINI